MTKVAAAFSLARGAGPLLSDVLHSFLSGVDCAESTRLAHADYARYLVRHFGDRPLEDFAGAAGGELVAGYLRESGLAYSSTRFRLNTLRLALEHAVARGVLAKMPEPWPIPRPGSHGHLNRGRYLLRDDSDQVAVDRRKSRPPPATVKSAAPLEPAPPGTETMGEALAWLLKHTVRRRTVATQRMHRAHARYLKQFFGADRPITEFRGAAGYRLLWEFVQLEGPEEGGRGIKFVTVKKRLVTLKMALTEGVKRGALDAVCPWPQTPSDATPRERYLTVDDYRRLRAVLPERWRLWVDLGVYTGQHTSDLDTMTWGMVDLGGGPGNEPGRGQAFHLRRNTKNKARPAWVVMPAELRHNLTVARRTIAPSPHPDGCIVGRWHNARALLRRACIRLGIPRVSPIDFRRTCATWWVERGGPKEALRKYLGHSGNSAMVERHYSQITPEMLEGGVEALNRAAGWAGGGPAAPLPPKVLPAVVIDINPRKRR